MIVVPPQRTAINIHTVRLEYDYDYEITLFEHKQNQHIIIIVQ